MRAFPILAVVGMIGWTVVTSGRADRAAPVAAQQEQDFRWTGRLDQGRTIEVRGVNGDVRAMAATGNEVEVTAVKREGRRGYVEDVDIEVVEHGGGVTICAVYPSRGDRPNECRPGGGHMNTNDNDTKVHFTVRVPRGVKFSGNSVNGDVDADGLGSDVLATTVNGSIVVSTDGYAEASTVNGSIRASIGRADCTGGLEFQTVNGSITLDVPEGLSADVRASTVNGSIETDFPLTVQGRFSARSMRGTIGNGGRDLRFQTVNGNVTLRRR